MLARNASKIETVLSASLIWYAFAPLYQRTMTAVVTESDCHGARQNLIRDSCDSEWVAMVVNPQIIVDTIPVTNQNVDNVDTAATQK